MLAKRLLAVVVFCGVVFGLTGCGEPEPMNDGEAAQMIGKELDNPPRDSFPAVRAEAAEICVLLREGIRERGIAKDNDAALVEDLRLVYGQDSSDNFVFENSEFDTSFVITGKDAIKFVNIVRKWQCPDTLP